MVAAETDPVLLEAILEVAAARWPTGGATWGILSRPPSPIYCCRTRIRPPFRSKA